MPSRCGDRCRTGPWSCRWPARFLSPIGPRLQSLRTCQNALDVLELGLAEGVSEDSLCPDMEFEDFLGETVPSESEA